MPNTRDESRQPARGSNTAHVGGLLFAPAVVLVMIVSHEFAGHVTGLVAVLVGGFALSMLMGAVEGPHVSAYAAWWTIWVFGEPASGPLLPPTVGVQHVLLGAVVATAVSPAARALRARSMWIPTPSATDVPPTFRPFEAARTVVRVILRGRPPLDVVGNRPLVAVVAALASITVACFSARQTDGAPGPLPA